MKARLLFSILLFLSGVELNAQNTFGDWLKRHETNRREQIVKSRVNQDFTKSDLGRYGSLLTRSVLNNKYYPPKVNREYTYYDTDGTVSHKDFYYLEFDSLGNMLLEEQGDTYRKVCSYGGVEGKMKLSETTYQWNGKEWVMHYIAIENLDVETLSAITAKLGTVTAGIIQSEDEQFVINTLEQLISLYSKTNGYTLDMERGELLFGGMD